MSLTPSSLRPATEGNDFSLEPGETKEESRGMYTVRAERSADGITVWIYKRLATANFYLSRQMSYETYERNLQKPINKGSILEAF